MITLRSEHEVLKMRKSGLLVWHALKIASLMVRPGIKTIEIDRRVERFFLDHGALPLFKGVPGRVPFPATICASINEEVVHGIPGQRVLKSGDIISIDTGCKYDGWCGDAAVTCPVGPVSQSVQKLLDVTSQTLQIAIEKMSVLQKWSEVAREMENFVVKHQFSVVETLVGHGIGRELHEEPQVPNYYVRDLQRGYDFEIRPGLVVAVEPMVNMGGKRVKLEKDYWTLTTVDKQPSAHFEHTIAVAENGIFVLTGPPESEAERIDISKYVS